MIDAQVDTLHHWIGGDNDPFVLPLFFLVIPSSGGGGALHVSSFALHVLAKVSDLDKILNLILQGLTFLGHVSYIPKVPTLACRVDIIRT